MNESFLRKQIQKILKENQNNKVLSESYDEENKKPYMTNTKFSKGEIVDIKHNYFIPGSPTKRIDKLMSYPDFTGKMLYDHIDNTIGPVVIEVLNTKTNKVVDVYSFSIRKKKSNVHEASKTKPAKSKTKKSKMIAEDGDEYTIDELIKENVRPWNVFDYGTRDRMSVKEAIELIKSDFDDPNIFDFVSDSSHEGAESIFKDCELDKDKYQDEFDQLRFAIEEAANYNWTYIMPKKVFFCDPKEEEFTGPVGLMGDKDEQDNEIKTLSKIGKKAGFSDDEIKEVYNNATYGGVGGVGIIGNLGDAIKGEISGDTILYIRDGMNGSGHYVIGNGTKKLKMPKDKLVDLIDYGSYSLGDVFGTNEWNWK